jgi:ATP-dependent Lhr-like helicase
VFPDQVACLENIQGDREIPDHPLVTQTIHDCLTEAMDAAGFVALIEEIVERRKTLVARDLPQPSPLAAEILSAQPYAFLDDAPLEERRTQAVLQRRASGGDATEMGRLDDAAIARVREEAQPRAGDADELHDALLVAAALTGDELATLDPEGALFAELRETGRAAGFGADLVVAAERLPELCSALGERELRPELTVPVKLAAREWDGTEARAEILRSRMSILGPTTSTALAAELGLTESQVDAALLALETEGSLLRGRFTPGCAETEWCDRALLARIHRYTLNRLRSEIRPVPATEYLRFLIEWQRLESERRVAGEQGLASLIAQLSGWEAAAGAWEEELLPARMARIDPAWLDALCLSGRAAWGRLRAPKGGTAGGPVRTTPISFAPRSEWRALACLAPRPDDEWEASANAAQVLEVLEDEGASFLTEIASLTGLLETQVEEALGELVAAGRVTCDGAAGLRALLQPASERTNASVRRRRARRGNGPTGTIATAGRWDRLRRPRTRSGEEVEAVARILLRRYGLVFRALLERESVTPTWRELLRALRRLEARGEVRGGRFVDRFSGEQFALPEAVGLLRAQRKREPTGELVVVSACDPLNLVGVLVPGTRLPAVLGHRLAWRDGKAVAALEAGRVSFFSELSEADRWDIEKALRRRPGLAGARALVPGG